MHTIIIFFFLLPCIITALNVPTNRDHELRRRQELPPIGPLLPIDVEELDLDQLIKSRPPNQEDLQRRQLLPEIIPLIKPLIPSRPPGRKVLQRRQLVPPVFPPIGPLIPIDADELDQLIPDSPLDKQILPPMPPHPLEPAHKPSPLDEIVPPIPLHPLEPANTPSPWDEPTLPLVPHHYLEGSPFPLDQQILPAGAPDPLAQASHDDYSVDGAPFESVDYLYTNINVNDNKPDLRPTKCPRPYQEFCCTELDYSGMQVKCVGPGAVRQLEDCLRFEPMPMCCCGINSIPRGNGKPPHSATFSCDPKCKALNMKRRTKEHE
ncbi:hypothetical protein QBC44DRAFT_330683 [Cladorrhinum sp. PSN332]|nr:hypothetical protein QBC44DRAFT_330683 [Cladorrhinum sp. PSN332]